MDTRLVTGDINFNDALTVANSLSIFCTFAERLENYRSLCVHDNTSFALQNPECKLPREPGWYVFLAGSIPIHSNQANDLDKRLNTPSGGLDYFTDHKRKSDPERNFVKRLYTLGYIQQLRVWFITVEQFSRGIHVSLPLNSLDIDNVTKMLNISRGFIKFLQPDSGE